MEPRQVPGHFYKICRTLVYTWTRVSTIAAGPGLKGLDLNIDFISGGLALGLRLLDWDSDLLQG